MATPHPDVLIIGAGVNGLTVATVLAEAGARVGIIAEAIPGATSRAAGAQWGPYLVEPKDRVRTWALESFDRLAELALDPSTTGVRMTPGVEASRNPAPPPDFADMVPDLAVLDTPQLPNGFAAGVRYTVPVLDMPVYLDYLLNRLRRAKGSVEEGHADSLADFAGRAPIIVNCAGIGAHGLVPDDTVYPIRGQLLVVENPGLTEWFSEDTGDSPDLTHWCPHGDAVVLGGQAAVGDWNTTPDPEIARGILARCGAIEPRLRDARVLEHRVGLRPTRPTVRLDTQTLNGTTIVHCYGHGGAGATLSWGCATEVRMRILNHE